jgi:sterol 3beta-glucosyltransferase
MWGRIVYELGVSPKSLKMRKLSAERLERALREALEGGRMAARAMSLSQSLSTEDGLGNAVRVIEKFAHNKNG